ncbi:hypothetical protein EYF80_018795 [Liparis tanakae]|uniref:Uncharacterized protein n=1 Tax=Liparis tanakae TaxID=230148 RepID=A0A4Z2HYP6_9TELE|nr:hypothetical protein EYF80_018795 [Liparis tanakae]
MEMVMGGDDDDEGVGQRLGLCGQGLTMCYSASTQPPSLPEAPTPRFYQPRNRVKMAIRTSHSHKCLRHLAFRSLRVTAECMLKNQHHYLTEAI